MYSSSMIIMNYMLIQLVCRVVEIMTFVEYNFSRALSEAILSVAIVGVAVIR